MLSTASAIIAALSANAAALASEIAEPNPKAMSQAEIRAFNAKLEKGHRYFIRCKRSAATGSFIERNFSCRTNEQWSAAEARGNDEARDVMEEMRSKSWNTSG